MSVPDQHAAESKLDAVFWNISKSHYIERDKPIFPDDCVYKLFRIFCMIGEMVENDDGQIEVYHQTEYYNKYFKRETYHSFLMAA